MKRTIGGILLFVMLLAVSVRADETRTVRIDALDLRIEVPAFYQVITRDTDASDPDLGAYIADVQQWMEENNIYLDLQNANPGFECTLSACPSPMERMDLFDDAVLKEILDQLRNQFETPGVTFSDAELIRTEQAAFFRFSGSGVDPEGEQVQLLVYYTVHRFQNLTLALRYEGAEMPETCRSVGEEMIASLRFGEEDDPAQEAAAYRDEGTGVSLTVPAGWIRMDSDPEQFLKGKLRPISEVEFVRTDDINTSVQYTSYDVFGRMPKLLRKLLPREEFDQEHLTVESIEAGIPYKVKRGEKQTINGREFCIVEYDGSRKGDDASDPKGTIAVFLQNGCYYVFRFSGTSDHPRYGEFLSMLESAEFPAFAPAEGETPATEAEKKSFRVGFVLGRIAVILAVVGIVLVVVARNKKKRAQRTAGTGPIVPAAPIAPAAPVKRSCAACCADLAPGETVCPYCGTKAQ